MNVRLTDQDELNNYLTYGKWDLDEKQIERLHKDEEMKQRVSLSIDEPATMDGLLKYSVVRVVVHYVAFVYMLL